MTASCLAELDVCGGHNRHRDRLTFVPSAHAMPSTTEPVGRCKPGQIGVSALAASAEDDDATVSRSRREAIQTTFLRTPNLGRAG